jgi:flagellar hook-associated protein 2
MNNLAGMDVDSLVAATMSVANLPLVAMQSQQQMLQAQVTDFNTIAASLSALQTSMSSLTDSSSFQANAATTSNANVVAATSNNNSVTGSYNLNVTSLATASYVSSAGTALSGFSAGTKAIFTAVTNISANDPNTAFNSTTPQILGGTVHSGAFQVNGQTITVTPTDTINTILNKITASSAGVNAALSGGEIVLTQKTAGATPTISVGSDTSGFLAAAGLTSGTLQAGTNATETQTLATALPGVTQGYFSINGTYIAVNPATDTMDSVVSKINSSNAGVQAFYDANANKITLTSTTPGNTAVQLGTYGGSSATDTSNFLSAVGLSQGNEVTGTAAQVTVNGVAVTPTGNTLSMNGNTFSLLGPGQSTVTVAQSTSSIVSQVQAFVTQYNSTIDLVMGKLTEQTVSAPTTTADQTAGDLNGNGTLQQILTQLQSYAATVVGAQPASMQQLSQAGLTTGAVGQSVADSESGHLTLDTTKLTAALESNPQAVANLFGQSNIQVTNEAVGTGNGTQTQFNLAHTNVSQPTIQVTTGGNTVTYNQVSGTPQPNTVTSPNLNQYSVNYVTGQITFGTAPTGAVSASYTADVSQGNQAGIIVQMSNYLNSLTEVGGEFDTITGTNGSLTNQISAKTNQISAMNTYLQTYQATLYTEYNASSVLLSQLKSQETILTALDSSSSSSSSS